MKRLAGPVIAYEKLPAEEQEGRKPYLCNAKHPKANLWCFLSAGHDADYHTAGLDDWLVTAADMKRSVAIKKGNK